MSLRKPYLLFLLILAIILTSTGFIFINLTEAESIDVSVEVAIAQCSDGLDNDSDGKTDFPDDPGCSSAVDNDETDPPPPPPSPSPSGGGGGGGIIVTSVILNGRAFPKSSVTILVNGVIKDTIIADNRASFTIKFNLNSGFYTFGVYSADNKGRRSLTYTFSLNLNKGTISTVSGIFIAPTININKSQVRRGDTLNILGQTTPSSTVSIFINSEDEIEKVVIADDNGAYFLAFNTESLNFGDHTTRSRSLLDNTFSVISQVLSFKVGARNILKTLAGDLGKDGRVNIIDFSVLLFWWGSTTPQALEISDINKDNRIDLKDLSIMLFHWTG